MKIRADIAVAVVGVPRLVVPAADEEHLREIAAGVSSLESLTTEITDERDRALGEALAGLRATR